MGSEIYDALNDHERRIKRNEANIKAVMEYLQKTGQLDKLTRRSTGSGRATGNQYTSANSTHIEKAKTKSDTQNADGDNLGKPKGKITW